MVSLRFFPSSKVFLLIFMKKVLFPTFGEMKEEVEQ